ncbi:MAG: RNA polymerase sigma factor [Devosia sp.]
MPAVGPAEIEAIWRQHSRKVLATLIRLLRNFDLAEEALHDAFLAAADHWPRDGLPANPAAWLISTGRNRAIDKLRRRTRFAAAQPELSYQRALAEQENQPMDEQTLTDDQLRLIFTCCHPQLPPDAQVALTLREVCGLTTEEIARAFLTRTPALAQRIVRAKARIRAAGLPYEVPDRADLPERLDAVLHVVYLVYNEGYSTSTGPSVTRADLSGEAIRLGRLILSLLPDAEVLGLLGLMLMHEARRTARQTADGELILLADQDRSLWDRALIAEASTLIDRAFAIGHIGPYSVQAAIAALHTTAPSAQDTDWQEIASLYGVLLRAAPSPIVQLNRAIAVGMARGQAEGLQLVEQLLAEGALDDYHLAHATKADMLRRLNRPAEARAAYTRALALCQQEPEQRFLRRRLAELATLN